jgi:hypothetical protein
MDPLYDGGILQYIFMRRTSKLGINKVDQRNIYISTKVLAFPSFNDNPLKLGQFKV